MLTIRPVAPEDNLKLASIIRNIFDVMEAPTPGTVYVDPTTDHLFELFMEEGAILWVALWEDKVVGCCGIYPTDGLPEGCVELVKYYIGMAFQGRGIGKKLFHRAIRSAQELGYKTVYLESMPAFAGAIKIYEKSGFQYLPRPLGHSGHSGCDVWMLRHLS